MSRTRYTEYRKPRQRSGNLDRTAWSTQLRIIGKQIAKGAYAQVLTTLNGIVAAKVSKEKQAEVLSFVGDLYTAQGKYDLAAATFSQAATLVQASGWDRLRPTIGQVRGLLKSSQTDAAKAASDAAVVASAGDWTIYKAALAQARTAAKLGQAAIMPVQPPSSSMVMAKLARCFFDEGELNEAKSLWTKAIVAGQAGAAKSCLGLAEIAMSENCPADAASFATKTLLAGGFQRKTLGAWIVLLRANSRLGIAGIDPSLLSQLRKAKGSVQDRAMLCIVKTLHSLGDPAWSSLAKDWMADKTRPRSAIIAAELAKLSLGGLGGPAPTDPRAIQAAVALSQIPYISPGEWLFSAKRQIVASHANGGSYDYIGLLQKGVVAYGESFRARASLAIAKALLLAKRQDLARPLFTTVIGALPGTDPQWGRAAWSLAKLEAEAANHQAAANWFLAISRNVDVPKRFRAQSRLESINSLVAAGRTGDFQSAAAEIASILGQSQDYRELLDCARQLYVGSGGFLSTATTLFARGEALAVQAFRNSSVPDDAVTILAKLALRQSDFDFSDRIVAFWNQLGPAKQQWLWTKKEDFWLYIGLVSNAMAEQNNLAGADQFADAYTYDSATPPHGVAIVGIRTALRRLRFGQYADALQRLKYVASAAPNHKDSAYAHYWLALEAALRNDSSTVQRHCGKVVSCIGSKTLVVWEQQLLARSICVANNFDLTNVHSGCNNVSDVCLACMLPVAKSDFNLLRANIS